MQPAPFDPPAPMVPQDAVRYVQEPELIAVPNAVPAQQPRVHVSRTAGSIQSVDVYCSCGEHIRLQCYYGDGAATARPEQ